MGCAPRKIHREVFILAPVMINKHHPFIRGLMILHCSGSAVGVQWECSGSGVVSSGVWSARGSGVGGGGVLYFGRVIICLSVGHLGPAALLVHPLRFDLPPPGPRPRLKSSTAEATATSGPRQANVKA